MEVPLWTFGSSGSGRRSFTTIQASGPFQGFRTGARGSSRSIKRIEIKKKGTQADIGFKVNSDFIAYRVSVPPAKIADAVKKIEEVTRQNGGVSHIRNPIIDQETGKQNDIIQYLFVYIPSVGYVAEFQVGDPFAFYTFTVDSQIRDLKDAGQPTNHIIDPWKKNSDDWKDCFYMKIRDHILNLDALAELKKAYGDQPPANLLTVLSRYL
jgi:hypothetical protein